MRFLMAGILAAVVSWVGNRAALRLIGTEAVVVLVPFIEEAAKSGAAVLTGASLVFTHGVFGLIEGIYDAWNSGWRGTKAGLASLSGHVFYGYVTAYTLQKYDILWAAITAGYLVHMLWNIIVMKFIVKKRGTAG